MVVAFLCTSSGCKKRLPRKKDDNTFALAATQASFCLLEGVGIPFDATVQQDMTVESTTGQAIFKIQIPPKKVAFLEEFFCNVMEQAGWLLQKKFICADTVLIDFNSLSRSCLIMIHREKNKELLSKKITIYIHCLPLTE